MARGPRRVFATLLVGLFASCASGYRIAPIRTATADLGIAEGGAIPRPRNGALTPREADMARTAWAYFVRNTQKTTGLANAVNDYPSTTMWDTASYLGALVAARELQIIPFSEFDSRLVAVLRTLTTLPLFHGELPNKVYDTRNATMVDYTNKPGQIGWSAIDIGRMLIWLRIIEQRYPQHAGAVDAVVLRWKFCHAIDRAGTLFGAAVGKDKTTTYLQEGRLGYEEYAAKGFELWGFDTTRAAKPEPFALVPIYGIDVPYDTRDPRSLGAHNYVVSESYVLDALELGWDLVGSRETANGTGTDVRLARAAQNVYRVQEARFRLTGKLTARTEHQLDQAPYFVYDTIYSDGYPWNTISDDGRYFPQFAAVSHKAALGLWVLWETPYTDLLFDLIAGAFDKERGFNEGVYENGLGPIKTWTANNNGIMLEILLFKVQGRLLRFGDTPTRWDSVIADEFHDPSYCYPGPRECGCACATPAAKPTVSRPPLPRPKECR